MECVQQMARASDSMAWVVGGTLERRAVLGHLGEAPEWEVVGR